MGIIKHLQRSLMIIFTSLYLYSYFSNNSSLDIILAMVILTIVIISVLQLPKVNLIISSSLFIIGCILLTYNHVPGIKWAAALNNNAGIAAMLITIHLLGLPFLNDNYQRELKHFVQKYTKNVFGFSILVSVTSYIIGACVNLGSVPITYKLYADNAKLLNAEDLFISSLMHGYIAAGFWAPAWASMSVVELELGISWVSVLPVGIFYGLVFMACSFGWNYFTIRNKPGAYTDTSQNQTTEIDWSQIRALLIITVSIISTIVIINQTLNWEIFVTVCIVAIIFPFTSSFFLGNIKKYKEDMLDYYNNTLLRVKNEVLLFIAAGFFGKSIELSGFIKELPQYLPQWLAEYSWVSIFSILAIMMLVSLAGVHPIVSSTVLLTTLTASAVGLTPYTYAITIITGFALATMSSPFSGISLITSGLSGANPWKFALKDNGAFSVAVLIFMTVFIKLTMGV